MRIVQETRIAHILALRLKIARLTAGLKVAELSEVTGISTHALYRYERGDYVPNAIELAALAKATGQTVAYFVEEEAVA